jgi:predicted dehydrogenase
MKKVWIIGAGQLGSRHLQALKTVQYPLQICVVDPNAASLIVAQERYDGISGGEISHEVRYAEHLPESNTRETIDLVIVATSSNVRRLVVDQVFDRADVASMVLEKILFQKKHDYETVLQRINSAGTDVRVNCSMRMMPFYQNVKTECRGEPIHYQVTGSQFGLVTNLIHYLDHMVYLTGCNEFTLDTNLVDVKTIPSKRQGFLELNGTIIASFADGSIGTFTCYAEGSLPVVVEVTTPQRRIIVKETENRAWISTAAAGWRWEEAEARILYQSEMTRWIAEQLLTGQPCELVQYAEAMQTHLQMLEPLKQFLTHKTSFAEDYYPFT